MRARFGTQLRHLLELCESAVTQSYVDAGLDYIPRYTPIVRALMAQEPATVGEIASAARISQPAATQTIALMVKAGIVSATRSMRDGRERLIKLTRRGRAMLPTIERCWDLTTMAHAQLEAELGIPLSDHLERAIEALEKTSLGVRIQHARTLKGRKH